MRAEFGSFVFDSVAHELTRDGSAIALTPKAFELLATLLTNRPRALSKAELLEAVWPDAFVSDNSLARLVSELRTALGEEAEAIRTVHGFGYAFRGEASGPTGTESALPTCWLTHGRRIVLLRAGENLIGRDPVSVVRIDSTKVSRQHSRILVTAAGATLEDLDSKNGTFLAGAQLRQPAPLADGDQVTIGPVVLTFRCSRDGLSTETELSMTITDP